ncbi:hypothetical protein [Devosia lacusdianchii]|uniref:hypothetical protein n=1 Tax=Devosia lacusdianchii TaxID=2917991 RepID=UPI001F0507BC|nr:hypothetical protein [Devosia sp. JXJ CY 41]
MKMLKIIAVAATLVAGVSASYASPFNAMGGLDALDAIDSASHATVLQANDGEASFLRFDNDVASVQQRIRNNPYLARTVSEQGFTIDQIVGVTGNDTDLTIYAL